MRNLTMFNIIKCDENQKVVHDKLFEKYYDRICKLENFDCKYLIEFVDEFHRERFVKEEFNLSLYELSDVLEGTDYKNGMDIHLDNKNNLVFMVYGQGYTHNGVSDLVTTKITVEAITKEGEKVDFLKLLENNKEKSITTQQER